jgi:hypothetical protein
MRTIHVLSFPIKVLMDIPRIFGAIYKFLIGFCVVVVATSVLILINPSLRDAIFQQVVVPKIESALQNSVAGLEGLLNEVGKDLASAAEHSCVGLGVCPQMTVTIPHPLAFGYIPATSASSVVVIPKTGSYTFSIANTSNNSILGISIFYYNTFDYAINGTPGWLSVTVPSHSSHALSNHPSVSPDALHTIPESIKVTASLRDNMIPKAPGTYRANLTITGSNPFVCLNYTSICHSIILPNSQETIPIAVVVKHQSLLITSLTPTTASQFVGNILLVFALFIFNLVFLAFALAAYRIWLLTLRKASFIAWITCTSIALILFVLGTGKNATLNSMGVQILPSFLPGGFFDGLGIVFLLTGTVGLGWTGFSLYREQRRRNGIPSSSQATTISVSHKQDESLFVEGLALILGILCLIIQILM